MTNSRTNPPKVSIIILNWNGLADTVECLESFQKVTYPNYQVILVDNASAGNDVAVLQEGFGTYIHVIQNEKNLGFAKGNNVGIRYALDKGADYVLLLNNDTTVDPEFLTEMVKVAEADGGIGIVCPKIYFYDRPDLVQFDGGVKISLWRGTMTSNILQTDCRPVVETEFATGAAMMIRARSLQKVGLLPEEYFFGVEDVDYSLQTQRNSFKIVVARRAVVLHKLSRTAGPSIGATGIMFQISKGWPVLRRKYMSKPAYLLSCVTVLVRQAFTGLGILLRSVLRGDWHQIARLFRMIPSGLKGIVKGTFSS